MSTMTLAMEPVPPPPHASAAMPHARMLRREDSMDRIHHLASHRPVLHRRHSHNHSRQSPKSLLYSKPASAAHRLVFMRGHKQGSPSLSHGSPSAVASRGDSSSVGIGTPQPSHHRLPGDKPPQASSQSAEPTPQKEIRRQHSWPLPPHPAASEAAEPVITGTPAAVSATTMQRAAPASSALRQPACSVAECNARRRPRGGSCEEEEVSSGASWAEEKPLTAAAVHVGENRKYDIVAVGFWLAALQQGCQLVKLSRRRPGRTKQRTYFMHVERTGAIRLQWDKARLFSMGSSGPVHLYGTEATSAGALEFRMYTSEGQIIMRALSDEWFQIWTKGMRSIIEYAKVLSWTLQL